ESPLRTIAVVRLTGSSMRILVRVLVIQCHAMQHGFVSIGSKKMPVSSRVVGIPLYFLFGIGDIVIDLFQVLLVEVALVRRIGSDISEQLLIVVIRNLSLRRRHITRGNV